MSKRIIKAEDARLFFGISVCVLAMTIFVLSLYEYGIIWARWVGVALLIFSLSQIYAASRHFID